MSIKRNTAGFTLVELIVVIAILAILAGIAVPVYSGYIDKAQEAADLQLLGAVNTAWAAACAETQQDPTNVIGTATLSGEAGNKLLTGISADGVDADTNARLNAAFMRYYGDNADKPFKVYTSLHYDQENGVFTGVTDGSASKRLAAIWKSNGNTYYGNEETMLGALDNVSGIIGSSQTLMDLITGNSDAMQTLFNKMFSDPDSLKEFALIMFQDETDASYGDDPDSYMEEMRNVAACVADDDMRADILAKLEAAAGDPDAFLDSLTDEESVQMTGLRPRTVVEHYTDQNGVEKEKETTLIDTVLDSAFCTYGIDKYGPSVAEMYGGTAENFAKMSSDMEDLKSAMEGKTGTELGNASVLYIAERTAGLDAASSYSEMQTVMNGLSNVTADSALPLLQQSNAIAGGSSNDIFTTTGMAYALATGYYNYKGTTAESPANLQGALDYIATAAQKDDFNTYMSTYGEADLEAYIAAMGAMNEKAGDISTGSATAFSDQLGWLNELLGN